MKHRVVVNKYNRYSIQVWRWYWPFWTLFEYYGYDEPNQYGAVSYTKSLKNIIALTSVEALSKFEKIMRERELLKENKNDDQWRVV